MTYVPHPNPWRNVPLVGPLIDAIQEFLVGLGSTGGGTSTDYTRAFLTMG